MKFQRLINGSRIYCKKSGSSTTLIALYVDDLQVIGNSVEDVSRNKEMLSRTFEMKDLGEAKKVLGISIKVGYGYTKLLSNDYIEKLLPNYNLIGTRGNTVFADPKGLEQRKMKTFATKRSTDPSLGNSLCC